jgi:hypothetical protein
MPSEFVLYKGVKYDVQVGGRGGKYILVDDKKVYVTGQMEVQDVQDVQEAQEVQEVQNETATKTEIVQDKEVPVVSEVSGEKSLPETFTQIPEWFTQQLDNIPNIPKIPLNHVFEDIKLTHEDNELWMEFGVHSGSTVNYIAGFTDKTVYGFDSFMGLPETWRPKFEKGTFNRNGLLPQVKPNVQLVAGWFNETLEPFLQSHPDDVVSFVHIDSDLYSSAMCILEGIRTRIKPGCIIVFDELVNYPGYDGETGELRALYQWAVKYNVQFAWIGMYGKMGMTGKNREGVAIKITSIDA